MRVPRTFEAFVPLRQFRKRKQKPIYQEGIKTWRNFGTEGSYRENRTPPVTVIGEPKVSSGVLPASTGWFSRFATCR
jgi:hypothetical protein